MYIVGNIKHPYISTYIRNITLYPPCALCFLYVCCVSAIFAPVACARTPPRSGGGFIEWTNRFYIPILSTFPNQPPFGILDIVEKILTKSAILILMEPQLEDKQYKSFLKWLVTPHTQKEEKKLPFTVPEYIEKYSLNKNIVDSFYLKDSFPDDIVEATISWAKTQTPSMAGALYERFMISKNSKDFTAFLEFIKINNKKEVEGSTFNQFNFINPTNEQYEQMVKRESSRIITGTTTVSEGGREEITA